MKTWIVWAGMHRLTLVLVIAILATPLEAGWSRAGLYGADVRAMVIDPFNPDRLFLGTSQGEVYLSTDAGATWVNPRAGNPFPGYVVDNLAIDVRGRLWAACWGLWGGGVIAVSGDGGVSWSRRDAGLEDLSVRALALDPSESDHLVVGGLTGVYRSGDAGRTWGKISEQGNVESLAIDPRSRDTIYVGTWRQAWRTDDGGQSWQHIAKGMVLDTDVFTININTRNPDDVWLSTCGWVYNSTDRGESWTRYRDGFDNRRIHAIERDPEDEQRIYAGSVAGLYRSCNRGKSWELLSDNSLVINAIGLHPDRPNRIILGTEGDGVYVSYDGGKSFARSNRGLYNVRVASVVPDPAVPNRAYAAVLFGNAASGVYQTNDSGVTWERISRTKIPEILSLVVQNGSDVRFVAGTEKGFYWSSDGVVWSPAEPSTTPIRVEKVVPYNRLRLFAATADGVFTSKDSGKSWYRLAELNHRTIDIALGQLSGQRALYALTTEGVVVFDGSAWSPIEGSPSRGRTLAIRDDGDFEMVVIAGSQGVKAGHIDFMKRWHETQAPAASLSAAVHQANSSDNRIVVLTPRERSELFITEGRRVSWRPVKVPYDSSEVVSVTLDPFDLRTFYVGTLGQGILIYRQPAKPARQGYDVYLGGGGSK